VYGLTALTAITAQNTVAVTEVLPLPARIVVAQIDAVLDDLGAHATKIGMLATAEIAAAVGEALRRHQPPHIVLDTVMIAKSGARLIDDDGVRVLQSELLPLAEVVTANGPEAAVLTGLPLTTVEEARRAAARLVAMGARAALVKGGHLAGPAIDVLYDGRRLTELYADRIATPHTHGTGCTFAAALASRLALGESLASAAHAAKAYVTRAVLHAPGLGHGHGPLGHFFAFEGNAVGE
jgi:hydroxymethylpyrimidine/phosphomethylpyrimidine kinase